MCATVALYRRDPAKAVVSAAAAVSSCASGTGSGRDEGPGQHLRGASRLPPSYCLDATALPLIRLSTHVDNLSVERPSRATACAASAQLQAAACMRMRAASRPQPAADRKQAGDSQSPAGTLEHE